MLNEAAKKGIKSEDFFQKVYRGSALEGLTHISPRDPQELEAYVAWLSKQKSPPQWAKDFNALVEKRLYELHAGTRHVAQIDELARARMLQETWEEFRAMHKGSDNFPDFSARVSPGCLSNALKQTASPH